MVAFRFGEKPGSGNSSLNELTREKLYFASGSTDENFVLNSARQLTPPQIIAPNGRLFRQDIRLNWPHAAYADVSVIYGPRDPNGISVDFDTSGGTAHITSSKSTVSRWQAPGDDPAPDMGGTIGVNGDDVDGTDIVVPAFRFTASQKHPQGVITMQAMRGMGRYTGYVNHDLWNGFNPGELLFLGASGHCGPDTETVVRYHFLGSENAQQNEGVGQDKRLTIGDIVNIVKAGHDYCWVRYVDAVHVDGGGVKRPVKKAKHVYVERVYSRVSFAGLFPFALP